MGLLVVVVVVVSLLGKLLLNKLLAHHSGMPRAVLDTQIFCHRQVAVRTVYLGIVPLRYSVQCKYSPPYPQ